MKKRYFLKKGMKAIALNTVLFFLSIQLFAQDEKTLDPISNFSSFYEMSAAIQLTRVNTAYTRFCTDGEDYEFRKNNYLPTSNLMFNFGWLINDKTNTVWRITTGFNYSSKAANLKDAQGNRLRLNTAYLQIPLKYGFREPIAYADNDGRFFHAIGFDLGLYAATPIYQRLDSPNNLDGEGKSVFGNYLRFGVMLETYFSAFDKNAKGHKFGLRLSTDFIGLTKFKETPSELYPYYYSIGISYNFINDYYK